MSKPRKRPQEHDNTERWMVSYADFVTLLFCFFTAMYAISNIDTSKLGKFVDSMRSAFDESSTRGNSFAVIEGVQVFLPTNVELESNVRDVLGTLLHESRGNIQVKSDRRGVVISVVDKFFFKTGSATLKDDAKAVLDQIVPALYQTRDIIRVEGHTDNIPIKTAKFASNWELSSSRAINVAKYFIDSHGMEPERFTTVGYSKYRPIASNDTSKGRSKNRRVDIVILNAQESKKEP